MRSLVGTILLLSALASASPLTRKQNIGSLQEHNNRKLAYRNETQSGSRFTVRAKPVDTTKTKVEVGVKQYSGYFDDIENDNHMFFWFFESRSNPKKDPIILEVSGGPGCSGTDQIFGKFGPSDQVKGKIIRRDVSLHNYASILYIDQPANTAFSYSKKRVNNSIDAAHDLADILVAFFDHFPEYSTQDLHIDGVSYAGRIIPPLAHEILSRPANLKPKINLKSIMMGNSMIDPASQSLGNLPTVCGKAGYTGMATAEECKAAEANTTVCRDDWIKSYDRPGPSTQPESCNAAQNLFAKAHRYTYDLRVKLDEEDFTPAPGDPFFELPEIRKAIGAERPYESCSTTVMNDFAAFGDGMRPYHRLLPDILKKIPVLIYAGDADFLCTWLGNLATAEAIEFPGQADFKNEKMKPFVFNGTEYGQTKTAHGLTALRVYEAGHGPFSYKPEAGAALFPSWLKDQTVPHPKS
ncbi:hypothetical protein TWF694_003205 [Orbilia ellipsospora]|uniref:carboxypeptidase C n=1 Tax=Orbilia ellipsospora TaxID=2528407 RepID=A0AAV9X0V3_9PEZI